MKTLRHLAEWLALVIGITIALAACAAVLATFDTLHFDKQGATAFIERMAARSTT